MQAYHFRSQRLILGSHNHRLQSNNHTTYSFSLCRFVSAELNQAACKHVQRLVFLLRVSCQSTSKTEQSNTSRIIRTLRCLCVLITNKKAVLPQGNRTMPQVLFSVQSSPTTFTTSLRVTKLRKPGFRAPHIPALNRI